MGPRRRPQGSPSSLGDVSLGLTHPGRGRAHQDNMTRSEWTPAQGRGCQEVPAPQLAARWLKGGRDGWRGLRSHLHPEELPWDWNQPVPCLGCPLREPCHLLVYELIWQLIPAGHEGQRVPKPHPAVPLACRGPRAVVQTKSPRGWGRTSFGLSPVSSDPRTEWPPPGGWSCGWRTAGSACPPPATGRTSVGRRQADESSASSARRSGPGSGH